MPTYHAHLGPRGTRPDPSRGPLKGSTGRLLGEERLLAVWLLLCAMLATSALVYHLSTPEGATPSNHQGPHRRSPASPVLAAAFPDLPPHMRAEVRATAVPTVMADPRAGSLPDSPPIPLPPSQTYTVPPLQPVSLVGPTGPQIAISAQLLRQSGSHLATTTAGYLPSTSMLPLPPRHRARTAAMPALPATPAPGPSRVAMPVRATTLQPGGTSATQAPGPNQVATLARPATASATPGIVYLVVTATPNPNLQYQQAALQTALQPSATAQPTPVPPAATPSFGHTQQIWITGYIDQGLTATGMQAGPGICAVDPSYIAMGTRIVIDGVGACLAEDTGSAVLGPHVDVWVPTDTDANAITGWHTASW